MTSTTTPKPIVQLSAHELRTRIVQWLKDVALSFDPLNVERGGTASAVYAGIKRPDEAPTLNHSPISCRLPTQGDANRKRISHHLKVLADNSAEVERTHEGGGGREARYRFVSLEERAERATQAAKTAWVKTVLEQQGVEHLCPDETKVVVDAVGLHKILARLLFAEAELKSLSTDAQPKGATS